MTRQTKIKSGTRVRLLPDPNGDFGGELATVESWDRDEEAYIVAVDGEDDISLLRRDQFELVEEPTTPKTRTITTQPTSKKIAPRTVEIVTGTRVDRHHNDDGSVTLYARGLKIFRTASDEDVERGEVAEDYDADEAIEKFLKKWFGGREWLLGRTTHGNFWKKTKAKREAEAAALLAAQESTIRDGQTIVDFVTRVQAENKAKA